MGREIILFKSEEKKSSSEAAETLRIIADKIEGGQITLASDNEEVVLSIPSQVKLEIKAEEEEGRGVKRSLEVEIEWVEGMEEDTPQGVTIS